MMMRKGEGRREKKMSKVNRVEKSVTLEPRLMAGCPMR